MQHAFRVAQFLAIGYANFGARGFTVNETSFSSSALSVDLTSRHYIVTGATSGLGRVTAKALAERGAVVHLLCRDAVRGERVREEIVKGTGNSDVMVHICDVSSLKDVQKFATMWNGEGNAISALVNNAGVMLHEITESEDGQEKAFATNTLGTFALTEMLRPWLEDGGRVVTVSSGGMLTQKLVSERGMFGGGDLRKGRNGIDGSSQYSRNKRQQVALTEYWSRKWEGKGIFWASMHPGWAGTPGLEKSMPEFYRFTKDQLRTEQQGADTIVYLAVADEAVNFPSGEFFFDRKPARKHLWMSGTGYKQEEVDNLVDGLKGIVKERGFELPS